LIKIYEYYCSVEFGDEVVNEMVEEREATA
jgi:hypothetical protein